MQIDSELAAFMGSAVTIVVGTAGADGHPEIGRAVGARVDQDASAVELIVSAWQWPDTIANVRTSRRAAVTFARPSDYTCYQLKGRAAVRSAAEADVALAQRYMTAILAELERLGLTPDLAAPWLTSHDAMVLRLEPEFEYVQTPGAKAGRQRKSGE